MKFKCDRCGYCCSHLITVEKGCEYGLYLNLEEVKYFPKEFVEPLFKDENDNVFAYQLNSNVCPNLEFEDKKSRCKIYENRPMECRTFPVMTSRKIEFITCQFTKKHQDKKWNLNSLKEEYEALDKQLIEFDRTPVAKQMYIMNLKKWITHD